MRTNDNNLIESIIGILTNIDIKKTKDIVNKANKTALLDYINKEFLNLKEYKALIENIKLEKEYMMILDKYKNNLTKIRDKIDTQDINFYIDFIINSLFEANKYFNDQEPWKKKEDLVRLNTIVFTTLEIVRKISFLLYPIIPQSTIKALKIFDLNENDINFASVGNNEALLKGSKLNKIDILFKKIDKNND